MQAHAKEDNTLQTPNLKNLRLNAGILEKNYVTTFFANHKKVHSEMLRCSVCVRMHYTVFRGEFAS